jgi:hypothetical protein
MAITLAQLKGNLRTINVTFFQDNFTVTYRPGELTPQNTSAIQERIESGEAENVLIEMLATSLVSWEVVDENGEPLPVRRDTLAQMPGPLLLAIAEAIEEDARPKSKSAGRSFAR